jgi:hypothetical protein
MVELEKQSKPGKGGMRAVRNNLRLPGALDFPTKSALILSAVTLAGLLLLSVLYAETGATAAAAGATIATTATEPYTWYSRTPPPLQHRALSSGYAGYSCNYIYAVTPNAGDAQCAFATTCNGGAGVWAPYVFCSNRFSRWTLCLLLSPVMLLWLVLLFRLLGSTAEDYFSPALEMFSVKLGLPPRFAGVTLLAL